MAVLEDVAFVLPQRWVVGEKAAERECGRWNMEDRRLYSGFLPYSTFHLPYTF
jgi:hypothetical protein